MSKAVLIALADQSNDEGHCWPSLATIAERTCASKRTVIRAIEDLEERKLIVADRSNGRHSTYQFAIEAMTESHRLVIANKTPTYPQPVTQSHRAHAVTGDTETPQPVPLCPSPVTLCPQPVPQSHPNRKNHQEPSVEPSVPRQRAETVSLADLVAEGCDKQHAKDWLAIRKGKKLPLTPTAWEAVKRDALAANFTPAQAVAISAEHSWAGFKPAWLHSERGKPVSKQAALDAANQAAGEEFLRMFGGQHEHVG